MIVLTHTIATNIPVLLTVWAFVLQGHIRVRFERPCDCVCQGQRLYSERYNADTSVISPYGSSIISGNKQQASRTALYLVRDEQKTCLILVIFMQNLCMHEYSSLLLLNVCFSKQDVLPEGIVEDPGLLSNICEVSVHSYWAAKKGHLDRRRRIRPICFHPAERTSCFMSRLRYDGERGG